MSLEIKRKELELKRVLQAREEMIFSIDERLEDIERIKKQILKQEERVKELETQLDKMKGNS